MHLRTSLPVLLLGAALVSPTVVHAYCRTTTVERSTGDCPERCVLEGLPLYWPDPELSYVLNERGFSGLDDATARSVLAQSFGAWSSVGCSDGLGTGLDLQADPGTTQLEVGPAADEPNDNVIVHFSREQWLAEDLNPAAYALTAIWYDKKSGRILGADMHFNGGMGQFGVCPDSGCRPGVIDLRNVATHEAGHFLGLAHSDVMDSTMWCSAEPAEVDKRSLAADDVEGICEIYPSSFEGPGGPGSGGGSDDDDGPFGCSAAPGRSWSSAAGLASLIGALAFAVRRRRRR